MQAKRTGSDVLVTLTCVCFFSACGGGSASTDPGLDSRSGDVEALDSPENADSGAELAAWEDAVAENTVEEDAVAENTVEEDAASDSRPALLNVIEKTDLGATWKCNDPATCTEDYYNFLEIAPPTGKGWTADSIIEMLTAIDAGEVPLIDTPQSPEVLAQVITETLGTGFLLEGLSERELTVTTIATSEQPDCIEKHLLFEDPWVGVFEGILLLPKGAGPFPAVLALHGHNDTAAIP
ncbi:MAG: hypothetical protein FJ109_20745, partial [Deltaproteobacteria bacterium]|nr:hypothetical protein [Deltaproteobacteria bacterium]